MNGELAQLVALAVQGSAWLGASAGEPPTFAESSTFQFVRSLEFRWVGRGEQAASVADDPAQWLRQFRGRGGQLLLLARQRPRGAASLTPYDAAAFANGGGWALHGWADGGGERWAARWSPDPEVSLGRKPIPADKRIWDVRYQGTVATAPGSEETGLGEAGARLVRSVGAAVDFAKVEGWTTWAEWLGKSVELAASADPRQPYHQDLLLPSTPLEVSRVLASASQAWVFGGMGWWNDQAPERHSDDHFEAVTADLYDAVLDAIVAATNAAAISAHHSPAA